MKKTKVISSQAMKEIEKMACSKGCLEKDFMRSAGRSIAQFTEKYVEDLALHCKAILLVGKGNNGGDAYAAGIELLHKGFQVKAYHLYNLEECSPLCKDMLNLFLHSGGIVQFLFEEKEMSLGNEGIILDGLTGTGFKGSAEGILKEVIDIANRSKLPILAIDIPSGLSGDTGEVGSVAIFAKATIYLELPKIGFFLKDGWNHVGLLVKGSFGLPPEYIDAVQPTCFLLEKEGFTASHLPKTFRTQNKYDCGYVLNIAGSFEMAGAGILSSYAALRSGAGIVRWFYPVEMAEILSSTPWEIIKEPYSTLKRFKEELSRAKSVLIGPGIGRGKKTFQKIASILSIVSIPCIIDADALFFLAKHPCFAIPKNSLLTPHLGEMAKLLDGMEIPKEDLLKSCQSYVESKQTSVLLKGAPNFLFRPEEVPCILPFGNPGMATAGTGDVLSGVLAALLSQGLSSFEAAVIGSYLHGMAGDIAAEDKTVFSMTASDLLENLPEAFSSLRFKEE